MNRGAVARWAAILTACAALSAGALAQDGVPEDLPVVIEAEEMTYDRESGVVTASGSVEIVQGEHVLRADNVSYDVGADTIVASGNVTILEPTGEVVFAENVELTDAMKEGFIEGFRMLLQDDSRLVANSGQRIGGVETEMRKAAFSPCNLCPEHPERAPLWQVKAVRVVHNTETHDIVYRDAWLELFGVPVFYTPYLRHPDPTVERRTGFLTPVFGTSTDLGLTLQTPFYWAIAPDRDLILDPILTTKAGVVFSGEYRQRFASGEIAARGSATVDDDGKNSGNTNRVRAHVDSFARFNLNDNWRWGADVKAATDDTYLDRYGISTEDTLTSHAFAEGFFGRSYAVGESYYFQGLRQIDNQGQTPFVLPKLDYNFVSEPTETGAVYSVDANFQALTRESGADTQRMTAKGGWRRSFDGPLGGDQLDVSATLQADVYHVIDSSIPPQEDLEDGFVGRIFPQASVEWRYPLVRQSGESRQLIEPVASVVVAPNGGNPGEIPNEDSRVFEFDDTNLFQPSRFPGTDRVEGGQRVNYGLNAGWHRGGGGRVTGFVGQSYRLRDDNTFEVGTGLEKNRSDIVGRVTIEPSDYISLQYRFRLDEDDLSAESNELQVSAGPDLLRFDVNYLQLQGAREFNDREEVYARASSQLTENWSATANVRHDLTGSGFTTSWGGGIKYQDECIVADLRYNRKFTRNRDVPSTDTVFLRVSLRHLGEFQQRVF